MQEQDQPLSSEDILKRNLPANSDLIREAVRLRKELENLGLWEDNGPQVLGPFMLNPDSPYLDPSIEQINSRKAGFGD